MDGAIKKVSVCVKASAGDAFTETRLMPAFRFSTGFHVEHRPIVDGRKAGVWGFGVLSVWGQKQRTHHLFDFGQFRLWPISTSAESVSASWPSEVELAEVELAEVEHLPFTPPPSSPPFETEGWVQAPLKPTPIATQPFLLCGAKSCFQSRGGKWGGRGEGPKPKNFGAGRGSGGGGGLRPLTPDRRPRRGRPPQGRPKFRSFFFPLSRLNFHSFFPLLGIFSWKFGGVLKDGTLNCACLGSWAGMSCPAALGAPCKINFPGSGPTLRGPTLRGARPFGGPHPSTPPKRHPRK